MKNRKNVHFVEDNSNQLYRRSFAIGTFGLLVSACGGGLGAGNGAAAQSGIDTLLAEGGELIEVNDAGIVEANKYRQMHGLSNYQALPVLHKAAQLQALQMAKTTTMDHDIAGFGPNSTFASRVKRMGVPLPASENVAYGYRDVARATKSWYDSPGHRKNMLTPNYDFMGVAGARHPNSGSTIFWCGVYCV